MLVDGLTFDDDVVEIDETELSKNVLKGLSDTVLVNRRCIASAHIRVGMRKRLQDIRNAKAS